MAYNLDANKTREACEGMVALLDGGMKDCIVDAYNTCKAFGEGFPMVDDLKASFHKLQNVFNDDFLTNVEKIKKNMEQNAEFAELMSKLGGATTATAGDMGTVKDSNAANAAAML